MSLGWMDDHVRRLVDQGEEFILIQNFEGNILGHWEIMSRGGQGDADLISVAHPVAGFARFAVDLNAVRFDDSLNDGSAAVGEHGRQILIEAEPFDFVFGGELDDLWTGRKRGRRGLHGRYAA